MHFWKNFWYLFFLSFDFVCKSDQCLNISLVKIELNYFCIKKSEKCLNFICKSIKYLSFKGFVLVCKGCGLRKFKLVLIKIFFFQNTNFSKNYLIFKNILKFQYLFLYLNFKLKFYCREHSCEWNSYALFEVICWNIFWKVSHMIL